MDKDELLSSPMQRGRSKNSKQIQNFLSDLDISFENKTILEIGCGKGNLLRDLKISFPGVKAYGIDLYSPAKENLKYFQHLSLDLNQKNVISSIKNRFDIIFSFRCFMYLDIDKRINLIKECYEKLNPKGSILIDICGSKENPSELSEEDFKLLSYLSKNLRTEDKLIKKEYKTEIELLDEKPTEQELKIIKKIKDIQTYSLFIKKNNQKLNI